jgi:hypothetical protein
MYRTAVVRIYDVLDKVFINVQITEYPSTPGTVPPDVFVISTSTPSVGDDNWSEWLDRGLSALQDEAHR